MAEMSEGAGGAGRPIGRMDRCPGVEHAGWLEQMVVDREDRGADWGRLGIGQQAVHLALAPVQPDGGADHDEKLT